MSDVRGMRLSWLPTLVWGAVALVGMAALGMAGEVETPAVDAKLLSGLQFRAIGPALMSGRISDIVVDPRQPNTWYVAAGSGGIWKTTNGGTTWKPIFDRYPCYSIGCLMLDPHAADTIWVGTGEAVGGRHVGVGDGVYISRDGGESFHNLGLRGSEHIAKILIDPRNSQVVYVAAQGPLWSSGGERGLYKSTDGGATWECILAKGPWTGVTDIALDPRNADVLYAATHQRHRTVAALINGGPESGIFKSRDGGAHWEPLTRGLPDEDKGKIAIGVSPQQPDVVYASIELAGRTGGIWRSTDGGASWAKMSDYASGGTGPHYYQEIWLDPHRFDVIYHANVVLGRSEDGGRTWTEIGNSAKHVDNHAVAFHPTDPDFLLVGCDGGVYKSYDRGATYAFTANLPLTQFYKVDVDYDWPVYHVVGGTQDNATQYGPARTLTRNGIRNADWRITIGGDGHDCAIHPDDPNIVYCESQQGFIRRFDRRTGQSIDIRPQPGRGEENFRFNWDAPIHTSPHSVARVYIASNFLHRSDDRGDSWTTISPDLTRNLDRFMLKLMGRIWSIDALWDLYAMSHFSTITSISESPLQAGLIYVGTDDGLIQVTEDGGRTWRQVDRIFGVPEFAFVNDIKADRFDANVAYAALDNHKEGDYRPYVIKSEDRGRTWKSLAGDLPERHLVWRVVQDHEVPNLLFAGTEYGVFVTLNGGENWLPLTGGLPTISIRDLEIQRRENDLVAATFGRGFYVLDDYAPLRRLAASPPTDQRFCLFPIKKALLYIPDDRLGGRTGSQGSSYFSADNPPYGAVFTVYVRDTLQTRKQARAEREAEVRKAGGDNPYPGWEALKIEDREKKPAVILEIRDARGNVVDRLVGPSTAGLHRIAWDLQYAPFTVRTESTDAPRRRRGDRQPLVVPGKYSVQMYLHADGQTTAVGTPESFEVELLADSSLPQQDRRQVLDFQLKLGQLQQDVTAVLAVIGQAQEQVAQARTAIERTRQAPLTLLDEARNLELKLLDAQEALAGDPTRTLRQEVGAPSVVSRIQTALAGSLGNLYGVTKTQRQQAEIASQDFTAAYGRIRRLTAAEVPGFLQKLDAAGVPWTPGRKLPASRSPARKPAPAKQQPSP